MKETETDTSFSENQIRTFNIFLVISLCKLSIIINFRLFDFCSLFPSTEPT